MEKMRVVMKMKRAFELVNCPLISTVLYSNYRLFQGKGQDE
jgi:hypothetical protein